VEVLLLALVVLAAAWFVTAPLRRPPPADAAEDDPGAGTELADLEARKEAKYREIRDAQLDHAQGKLTDEDFERIDAELRAEAIEILKGIDRAAARGAG
jgi:hypothetical protein